MLIESYDSNLTFRKGPVDLFYFQDKFVYLDEPIAVFGYKQRVTLATVRFLKSAGSFLDEARVSWYSFHFLSAVLVSNITVPHGPFSESISSF